MKKLLILAAALAVPMPALAQPPSETDPLIETDPTAGETFDASGSGPFAIEGEVTLVTDYRFRGISQTGERPAIQGSVEVAHQSGVYAGLWASTLDNRSPQGAAEINLYGGYRGEIAAGTDIDVGVEYQLYPDGSVATDYVEPYAILSHTFGPVTAQVGANYAPEQEAVGDEDNIYVFGGLSGGIPGTPVTLSGRVGYSDGGLAPGGSYVDWTIGAEVVQGPLRIGLFYVDTDLPEAPNVDSGLFLSARFAF